VAILDPRTGECIETVTSIQPVVGLPPGVLTTHMRAGYRTLTCIMHCQELVKKLEEVQKRNSLQPKRVREKASTGARGGDTEEEVIDHSLACSAA
jgi:hypothetical protein